MPLILHLLQRWRRDQRRTGAPSHVDLVKTVINPGGGKAPEDWNGDSMLPWLDDPQHAWKDCAASGNYGRNIGSGHRMLRSGDWKYTCHSQIDDKHPAQRQLFNLATTRTKSTMSPTLPKTRNASRKCTGACWPKLARPVLKPSRSARASKWPRATTAPIPGPL